MSASKIIARQDPPGAYIEGFAVPLELQGQGHGRRGYESWEASLSPDIQFVALEAVLPSRGFWLKMGFVDVKEFPGFMMKAVNGFTLPFSST